MKKKIVHLATGLGMGGAENSLANLLAFTDLSIFDPSVLSLSDTQPIGDRIGVMREGRMSAILDRRDATQQRVMELATASDSQTEART